MLLAAAGAANLPAAQAGAPENAEGTAALDTVTVVATGISNMSAASAGDVSQHELASQPLLRPGAVLENVPGLLVTQHSGEGKANQYFLRAFNLDHGTDLATEIDDIPVNISDGRVMKEPPPASAFWMPAQKEARINIT